jgi:hypothetical protein
MIRNNKAPIIFIDSYKNKLHDVRDLRRRTTYRSNERGGVLDT